MSNLEAEKIGPEYFDNANRLMSNVEERLSNSQKKTLFSFTSSLTNSLCFNVHPFISMRKNFFREKQLHSNSEKSRHVDIIVKFIT